MRLYDVIKLDAEVRENRNRLQRMGYADRSEEDEECLAMNDRVLVEINSGSGYGFQWDKKERPICFL